MSKNNGRKKTKLNFWLQFEIHGLEACGLNDYILGGILLDTF